MLSAGALRQRRTSYALRRMTSLEIVVIARSCSVSKARPIASLTKVSGTQGPIVSRVASSRSDTPLEPRGEGDCHA